MMTNERTVEAGATVDEVQLLLNKKARRKDLMMQLLPFVGLVFVFVFFLISTKGRMIELSNLSNVVEQCFTVTVVAVGATFVYACGSMDISTGAVMALSQLLIGYAMLAGGVPIPLLLLIGIGTAVACTAITGFITSVLRVPAFIVSLCMMNICTGIVTTAVSKKDMYIPYSDYSFMNTPLIKGAVLVLIIVVGMIVFNKMRLGRDLKAIGGNAVAAQQSGVNKNKTIIIGFVCLGICLGIAGFFSIVRVGVVTASSGSGLGLNILVAIVLGGFPLTGGAKARMIGAIMGAITITLLSNGLALMGVDSSIALFVKGLLFLIIVAISYDRSKGKLVS